MELRKLMCTFIVTAWLTIMKLRHDGKTKSDAHDTVLSFAMAA